MEKQEDIEKFFLLALDKKIKKYGRGAQAMLARKTGLPAPYINRIAKGHDSGSEKARRLLSDAFGETYEEMINIGRGRKVRSDKTAGIDIAENIIRKKEVFADPLEGGKMRIKRLLQDAESILQSNNSYARLLAMNIDALMLLHHETKRKKVRKRSRPQPIGQDSYL